VLKKTKGFIDCMNTKAVAVGLIGVLVLAVAMSISIPKVKAQTTILNDSCNNFNNFAISGTVALDTSSYYSPPTSFRITDVSGMTSGIGYNGTSYSTRHETISFELLVDDWTQISNVQVYDGAYLCNIFGMQPTGLSQNQIGVVWAEDNSFNESSEVVSSIPCTHTWINVSIEWQIGTDNALDYGACYINSNLISVVKDPRINTGYNLNFGDIEINLWAPYTTHINVDDIQIVDDGSTPPPSTAPQNYAWQMQAINPFPYSVGGDVNLGATRMFEPLSTGGYTLTVADSLTPDSGTSVLDTAAKSSIDNSGVELRMDPTNNRFIYVIWNQSDENAYQSSWVPMANGQIIITNDLAGTIQFYSGGTNVATSPHIVTSQFDTMVASLFNGNDFTSGEIEFSIVPGTTSPIPSPTPTPTPTSTPSPTATPTPPPTTGFPFTISYSNIDGGETVYLNNAFPQSLPLTLYIQDSMTATNAAPFHTSFPNNGYPVDFGNISDDWTFEPMNVSNPCLMVDTYHSENGSIYYHAQLWFESGGNTQSTVDIFGVCPEGLFTLGYDGENVTFSNATAFGTSDNNGYTSGTFSYAFPLSACNINSFGISADDGVFDSGDITVSLDSSPPSPSPHGGGQGNNFWSTPEPTMNPFAPTSTSNGWIQRLAAGWNGLSTVIHDLILAGVVLVAVMGVAAIHKKKK